MPERKHRFVSAGRYRFGNQFKETKRLPLHTSKEGYSKFVNFVFPLKQTDNGDYCNHLIQSFKLIDPISLEILKISNPDFIFINEDWIQNVKYKVMMDDIIRLN